MVTNEHSALMSCFDISA